MSALELARIADRLEQRVEWLLSDAPQAIVSRRNARAPGEPSPELDRVLDRLVREIEFLQEQGALTLDSAGPLELSQHRPRIQEAAAYARQLMGFQRDEPAVDLARRASAVGLLVFSLDLGQAAADGGCVLLSSGAVAVVNGSRKVGRRRLTLAHEIAHYLFADEFTVDWRIGGDDVGDHEARIDFFARALLLPAAGLRDTWSRYAEGGVRIAAVRTASEYRVDMATLARRLVELEIISPGESSEVRKSRTARSDIVDFDLYVADELAAPELPRKYEEAVLALYRSKVVSAPRAVELLLKTWDEADLPDLRRLSDAEVWQFIS